MEEWRPSAPLSAVRRRAELLTTLRLFFADRGVLEVETPLVAATAGTDPHLQPLVTTVHGGHPRDTGRTFYLQTSPEFAMKRLLAAGSGSIYQICKAFRDGEAGRMHNPEFTILEWYRPGFDHHRLMDEMDELLAAVLGAPPAHRHSYRDIFLEHVAVDPLTASNETLRGRCFELLSGPPELATNDRDGWLDLLLTHAVEPKLGRGRPSFIFDYPAQQAALARIRPGSPPVAERFEVYVEGVEIANGYHELADAAEQSRRFQQDLARREGLGLPPIPTDQRLLEALGAGFPECAGVALGVDRLLMLMTGATRLDQVVAFTTDRA